MPSLSTQQQIEELILGFIQSEAVSPEDADEARRDLMRYADAAERGDAQAAAALAEYGIEVGGMAGGGAQPTTGGGEDWRTQIPIIGGAFEPGGLFSGNAFAPGGLFGPAAAAGTATPTAAAAGQATTPTLPPGTTAGPLPGTYYSTGPGGKTYLWSGGSDYEGPRILDEITGDASATGVAAKMEQLKLYEQQYGALSDADRQRFLLGFVPSGGAGGGGMTANQAAQLEQQRFENALAAARTAQPLSYLAAIRGAVPGAGGTDLYQGIRPVVPTIGAGLTPPTMGAAPSGLPVAGGATWEAPAQPSFMSTLQSGGRLGAATVPAGTIRIPGPQQQSEMMPYETGTYEETAAFQGIPPMDWQRWLEKSRRAVGTGLSLASYGGRLR